MENMQINNQATNTKPNNNMIKYIAIGGAALVALILIIVVFSSIFGGGYKKAIKGSIALVNKKTEGDLAFQEYTQIKEMREYNELSMKIFDQDDDQWEDEVEQLEDEFGDDYKIKYKISKSEKLKDDDLDDVVDAIEDSYESYVDLEDSIMDSIEYLCEEEDVSSKDQKKLEKQHEKLIKAYDDVKVTAAYEVTLKCTIKGDEGEEDFKIKDIIIAKVNGEWILTGQKLNPSSIVANAIEE